MPEVSLQELLSAVSDVLKRAELFEQHQVTRETLSIRERMTAILAKIAGKGFVPFIQLFQAEEGKLGVVVTFMAILELVKESLLDLIQNEPFAPIHVKAKVADLELSNGAK